MKRDYYDVAPPDPKEPRMKMCPVCHKSAEWATWTKCFLCGGTGEVPDDSENEPQPQFDTVEEERGIK